MIDLHMHTSISDNSLSIADVMMLAKVRGLTHIAITDHDTTLGLEEAIRLGKENNIGVVPGIEISAYDYRRNRRAHILGLFVEPGHPALEKLCTPLVQNRKNASYQMVKILTAAGYEISWDDVLRYEGGTGVFKQHIMHALMDKGYCEGIYGDLYQKLFRRGSTPETSGIAYIPLSYVDAVKAIQAVREAGGIPVLAHPGQLDNFDAIDEWAEAGLEGIEVFHPSHSEEDRQKSLAYAWKHDLFITGGSDFHGFYGEKRVEPGCRELSQETIYRMSARKKS